jgi:hypothetical protein
MSKIKLPEFVATDLPTLIKDFPPLLDPIPKMPVAPTEVPDSLPIPNAPTKPDPKPSE